MGAWTARERLHRLVDLARLYRGWTRKQLAQALGRDPTRVYPDTDNPKADFLIGLADALEWSVDEVVGYVFGGIEPRDRYDRSMRRAPRGADFETLHENMRAQYRTGDFAGLLVLARRAQHKARTPDEFARACNYEFMAWEGMGRYGRALTAVQRGLAKTEQMSASVRWMLQSNLALALLMLGEHHQARGCAEAILDWFAENPKLESRDARTVAFAHTIRGHAFRELASEETELAGRYARRAVRDLEIAERQFRQLSKPEKNPWLDFYADWNRWGITDCECLLGERDPRRVVSETIRRLDELRDVSTVPSRSELLGYGCACAIVAGIVLRHLPIQEFAHALDILIGKSLEIADCVGDWGLRRRAYTLRYRLHESIRSESGLSLDLVLDENELRNVVGLIGRFPRFRNLGWRVLDDAAILVKRGGYGNAT